MLFEDLFQIGKHLCLSQPYTAPFGIRHTFGLLLGIEAVDVCAAARMLRGNAGMHPYLIEHFVHLIRKACRRLLVLRRCLQNVHSAIRKCFLSLVYSLCKLISNRGGAVGAVRHRNVFSVLSFLPELKLCRKRLHTHRAKGVFG